MHLLPVLFVLYYRSLLVYSSQTKHPLYVFIFSPPGIMTSNTFYPVFNFSQSHYLSVNSSSSQQVVSRKSVQGVSGNSYILNLSSIGYYFIGLKHKYSITQIYELRTIYTLLIFQDNSDGIVVPLLAFRGSRLPVAYLYMI